MLKLLASQRKTTATTAMAAADRSDRSSDDSVDEYDIVVDDLSVWELINPSSSDDEADADIIDDFSLSEEEEGPTDEVIPEPKQEGSGSGPGPLACESPSSDISMDSLPAQPHDGGGGGVVVGHIDAVAVADDYDEYDNNVDEEDYDDYDDGYDLDDELVPWGVGEKFGRQRTRKLEKRTSHKMHKAMRLPYRNNRPVCVYAKHGFGVQCCYIK